MQEEAREGSSRAPGCGLRRATGLRTAEAVGSATPWAEDARAPGAYRVAFSLQLRVNTLTSALCLATW